MKKRLGAHFKQRKVNVIHIGTEVLLYLFFNFEKVLDHMEKEMNAQKRGISFVSGTSVGQFEATDMSPAYLTRSGSIPA